MIQDSLQSQEVRIPIKKGYFRGGVEERRNGEVCLLKTSKDSLLVMFTPFERLVFLTLRGIAGVGAEFLAKDGR